jgi:hypothetical protein
MDHTQPDPAPFDGARITGVFVDEVAGWRAVGTAEGGEVEFTVQPASDDDAGYTAHDVARLFGVPTTLVLEGEYSPGLAAALEKVTHASRTASAAFATFPEIGRTFAVTLSGLVGVPNPAWPARTGRRGDGETRAAHTGRRRVATAMRRRARRAGIPATIRRPRTVHLPRTHLWTLPGPGR